MTSIYIGLILLEELKSSEKYCLILKELGNYLESHKDQIRLKFLFLIFFTWKAWKIQWFIDQSASSFGGVWD